MHLLFFLFHPHQWQSILFDLSCQRIKTRGLFSPFLFILGLEVFSRLMFHEASLGHIKGLKISKNNPAIHHLLFVDDLIIFGQASLAEVVSINSCLAKYCSWFGQSINSHKSSISFDKNTNPAISASILHSLSYNPNLSSYIHLGLPIFLGISKRAAFQNILDQVHKKIDGWRAKTLSQAGRLVLIKSVAAAIPSYTMSTFMLLASICNKLDQSFKNFWWGFPPTKVRNLSLKSWSSLCLPKAAGGLVFRKMKEVNLALISKLG